MEYVNRREEIRGGSAAWLSEPKRWELTNRIPTMSTSIRFKNILIKLMIQRQRDRQETAQHRTEKKRVVQCPHSLIKKPVSRPRIRKSTKWIAPQ
jgi:hypothetical protein